MSNLLLDIIAQAHEQGWCTEPYCTTCGSLDYRKKLREFAGDLGGPLANALEDIDIGKLTAIPNWRGALDIAFMTLPLGRIQAEGALRCWLSKLADHIDFADHVLFRIVRFLPPASELKAQWIKSCLGIATTTQNHSLVESLILILENKATGYPSLMEAATKHAQTSRQMRRVLNNKCQMNFTLDWPPMVRME